MDKQQKRQVAYKIWINDILNGEYVKEEGEWIPNYIKIGNKKVSRVNLIAVVVSRQNMENTNYQGIILDDGSGKISVRSFDGNFDKVEIGDFVMVIGRPREYFKEKYIVSEIVKKVSNPLWAEVRKIELSTEPASKPALAALPLEESVMQSSDVGEKIFELIKQIDKGAGADTQEVISKANVEGAEGIITSLLERGEVFEIKPGRLKILE